MAFAQPLAEFALRVFDLRHKINQSAVFSSIRPDFGFDVRLQGGKQPLAVLSREIVGRAPKSQR